MQQINLKKLSNRFYQHQSFQTSPNKNFTHFISFRSTSLDTLVRTPQHGDSAGSIDSRSIERIFRWEFKTTDTTFDKDLHIEH
jgi:hypothetical protein